MEKIEIEIDPATLAKIETLTKTYHCQLSELIKAMLDQLTAPDTTNNLLIGQWQKDAEIVDEILENIQQDRI